MHIKDACSSDGKVVLAGKGYNGYIGLDPHLGTFEGLVNLELNNKKLYAT